MMISTTPTRTGRFVYCSADKSRYIIDDPVTQTRVGCLGGDENYEFKMKDGTKNTLRRALGRLDGDTRSYLLAKYNPSRIWLESIDAQNLMADLYNRDIISEDEFLHFNSAADEMVCGTGMKSGDQGLVPDQPNIYQALKALGEEKWEKAQHLEGEARDKMLKRSEMFTRLAGILKSVYRELQGIVTNKMMCESYHRSLQEIDSPYFSDEKNQEALAKFLEKAKDEMEDSLEEIASPRESAQERQKRLRAWEEEQFYQKMRNEVLNNN